MGYRMYVETTDGEELLCGGKLFGYASRNLCECYSFLKGYCYFTDQLDELRYLEYGNPCEFRFSGKIIKEFLNLYAEDFKKLRPEYCPSGFEHFDECIKKLNDNSTYVLEWF